MERKSDFFALDLETYEWTEMPSLGTPPSPRYFHSCCLYGNRLYLYGGYSGNDRLADMYAYDFETNHWSQIDSHSGDTPSGRSSLVAQVYENCTFDNHQYADFQIVR
jgi:N-acetylneuraminic acid mutarotase